MQFRDYVRKTKKTQMKQLTTIQTGGLPEINNIIVTTITEDFMLCSLAVLCI